MNNDRIRCSKCRTINQIPLIPVTEDRYLCCIKCGSPVVKMIGKHIEIKKFKTHSMTEEYRKNYDKKKKKRRHEFFPSFEDVSEKAGGKAQKSDNLIQ